MKELNSKIGFILGGPVLSGGTYVIFEHAIRIQRRGSKNIFMIMENKLNNDDLFWHSEASELNWLTFDEAKNICFDAVIATWWVTCYEAYRLKSKAYLYFNQSVESKFYPVENVLDRKYADSTYFLGLNIITEATWIKEYLFNKYDLKAELVLNGIRKDIHNASGKAEKPRAKDRLRILVEGPMGVFFKNTEKTIKLCLESDADEVWLMTSSPLEKYKGVTRVISQVPIHKTAEIYRSCDVLVKLSYVEGMFGPPLEIFHCGGTAIVYDVTGHDEYIKHDYNALVVKTDDEDKVVEYINFLKANPDELTRLKNGALETAAKWNDWETASVNFENAIMHSLNKQQVSQEVLKNKTFHFKEWYGYNRKEQKSKFGKIINAVVSPKIRKYLYVKYKNTTLYKIYNSLS